MLLFRKFHGPSLQNDQLRLLNKEYTIKGLVIYNSTGAASMVVWRQSDDESYLANEQISFIKMSAKHFRSLAGNSFDLDTHLVSLASWIYILKISRHVSWMVLLIQKICLHNKICVGPGRLYHIMYFLMILMIILG